MDLRPENARVGHSHGKDGSEGIEQQRRTADVACKVGPGSAQVKSSIKASDSPL